MEMQMYKSYHSPVLSIVLFDETDVLTSSVTVEVQKDVKYQTNYVTSPWISTPSGDAG